MKALRSLIFILIVVSFQNIHSQNYRDVFAEKYNQSKDSAKVYSNQLMDSKNPNESAFGCIGKGYILTKEGNYTEAQNLFEIGLAKIDGIANEKKKLAERLYAFYYYSNFLLAKHEMEQASEIMNQGLDLSIKLKDAKMQIKFKDLIGRGYSMSGLGDKAIIKAAETIKSIKALRSELSPSYYHSELLRTYLNTGFRALNFFIQDTLQNASYLDSTATYLDRAQSFIKEESFVPSDISQRQMLALQSDIFFFGKKYAEAIKSFECTLQASEALGMKKRVYQLQFRIAECYFFLEQYETSKELFDKLSSDDLKRYKLLKNNIDINYYYAQIYARLGDIDKAIKHAETFNSKTEDFYKTLSSNKVDVFTQSELKEKQRILNNLEAEEKANNYLTIVLSCIFLFSIGLLFYTRYQRKKFKMKMTALIETIDNGKKEKNIPVTKVKETKAQNLLLKLTKIEGQELFLNKNYSLNMVAKRIDSNSSYVSQIINTYWNKSFVDYTNELRINYILKKLKEDSTYQKFTLLAIAESIGYKSLSSFNKHFKNVAGVTPKQYLNYIKENQKKNTFHRKHVFFHERC